MSTNSRAAVNYFSHNDRTYMEVKPVETLMRSNMIADVIKRGDRFAVDMANGKLTVIANPEKIAAKEAILFGLSLANGNIKTFEHLSDLYKAITQARLAGSTVMTVSINQGGASIAAVSSTRSNFDGFLERLSKMIQIHGGSN